MKYVMIAYHMLESRSGAYLEWLSNELDVTAKTLNKGALLVMLLCRNNETASQIAPTYP